MIKSILQSVLQTASQSALKPTINNYVLWTPDLLTSKLLLWLDFTDSSVITLNGSAVASMTDKSSNARVFNQSVTASQPLRNSEGVFFDQSDDHLINNSAFIFNNSGGFRAFSVAKALSLTSGTGGRIISECAFTADSRPHFSYIIREAGADTIRNRMSAEYRSNTSGAYNILSASARSNNIAFSDTAFNLQEMQDTQSVYRNFINGVQDIELSYTRNNNLTGANRTVIGSLLGTTGTSLRFGGTLKHVIVTSNNLTTNELQRTQGFLWWNGACSVPLPSNHPYRDSPPYI